MIEGLESGFAALGLLDAANETDDSGDEEEEIDFSQVGERSNRAPHVEMGRLNHGVRTFFVVSIYRLCDSLKLSILILA